MRILLINSNRYRDPVAVIPVGICAVASSLEAAGHEVRVLDLCFSLRPGVAVTDELARFKPQLVGIGIRNLDGSNGYRPLPLYDDVRREVVAPCKAAFAGPIVIGGPSVGINAAELLEHFDLEYAVQGDGERALCELARRLGQGTGLLDVPGLVIRRNGAVVAQNPPDFIADLDQLPFARPERWLNLGLYRLYEAALPVQTKRGCALECVYCTYNRIEGPSYRLRSPRLVADEIEAFVRTTGIRAVELVDSTFNVPPGHAKAVLRELAARDLGLKVAALGLNPRFLDEELVELMKRTGFREASFGIDAACEPSLKSLGKNFGVADIERAATLIHRARIPAAWYLIVGAPGETAQTMEETFRTVGRIAGPLDLVSIGVGIRVYAGAPIAEVWSKEHGGPPAHGFLEHVGYEPKGLNLRELKARAVWSTAWHHNFLMFDEQANIPIWFRIVFGWLAPRQPIWRGYIYLRLLEKVTGLFLVRALAAGLFLRGWVRSPRSRLS